MTRGAVPRDTRTGLSRSGMCVSGPNSPPCRRGLTGLIDESETGRFFSRAAVPAMVSGGTKGCAGLRLCRGARWFESTAFH